MGGYKKHMKLFRFTFVSRRAQSYFPLFLTGALQEILYFQPLEFTFVSGTRVNCLKISKTHFFLYLVKKPICQKQGFMKNLYTRFHRPPGAIFEWFCNFPHLSIC